MKTSKAAKPSSAPPFKIYEYAKCSTCQKALKFLDARGVVYRKVDITTQAPTGPELKRMAAAAGSVRKLFNTSGLVYKELGLSAKLPAMNEEEAFKLLGGNGRLVRRPFLLGEEVALVGFKEAEWARSFSNPS